MNTPVAPALEFALLSLTSVFVLVDPIAVIPVYLSMTAGADESRRRMMAKRASITVFAVLGGFGIAGSVIFKLMGLTLPAFKIAGGLVLLQIGRDMLQAKHLSTKTTPEEVTEGVAKPDASVVPLGIPLLAGPGAISTVMVLLGESHHWWQHAIVYGSALVSAVAGARVQRYLGETGMNILSRLMGLLLMALAVQFFVNGLTDLGLIKHLPTIP